MAAWGTSIFSDDLAMDIHREYGILLSVGKENWEIEKMLTDYYADILDDSDPDGDVFWFALALCEWKKGRLTSEVKMRALSALAAGRDLARWEALGNRKDYEKRRNVLSELHDVILSPMPPAKKAKKPTTHHCPWQAGSLLAYRIISDVQHASHPCYGKYVLLRVIQIDRHPVSRLFATDYYDETMLVGLYDWIGEQIPAPQIADELHFIPLIRSTPSMPAAPLELSALESLPLASRARLESALCTAFVPTDATCAMLDWRPLPGIVGDITYLGCDENYQRHIPAFFRTSVCNYPITNLLSFDSLVANVFKNR